MIRSFCCSIVPPMNPLRLAQDFRDGWGDAHAHLVELTDAILGAGCFEPRIFHAPDSAAENVGMTAANPYIEFVLDIPPGSFILGYLHHATGAVNSNVATCPPVPSTFRLQITDVGRKFKFFAKPVPEAFFLNDAPSSNPSGPYANAANGALYELNPSPRLLAAPYPVAPPNQLRVEFWNLLYGANTFAQMSFLVAVPSGGGANGGSANGG